MASRRRPAEPPKSVTSEKARFTWWLKYAERGDGDAMVEVAERFERGRGVERSMESALTWYQRAVRAGVTMAPALVGETIFEHDPIAGIVWLMLGFERAPSGDEANPVLASTLAIHEPRLSDDAVMAAQVWADACRERESWPDEVAATHGVKAPFRARPPTPALPTRTPKTNEQLTKRTRFGPWSIGLPPAAVVETVNVSMHLRATWGGAYTQHLVWARLAPGIDIETYVKRSGAATARLWKPVEAAERFLLNGFDTTSCVFDGQGPSNGQRALKRFMTRDDQVAVLTAVAAIEPFEAKRDYLIEIADGARSTVA